MLLCAGILGRYYTDYHNVDEDMVTITSYGGNWDWASDTGITLRYVQDTPSHTSDVVASSDMKNSLIMRISMMSTKT